MAVRNTRQRYIGFEITDGKELERKDMIMMIRNSFTKDEYADLEPWLTVFTGSKGILRCKHIGKERALEILDSMDIEGAKVKTVITSGTIRKVQKKLFGD